MRQSQLFGKTSRTAPADEVSVNAKLLIRGGFMDKLVAGIYSYLPLGLRVLKKIEHIIREEMNTLGAQELLLPTLHPRQLWEQTGRWSTVTDLYKLTDSSQREFALGATHEEVITPLAKRFVQSHRDLPLALYQFQTKFRMELRAKSGLLRAREFLMKDLYSFHATQDNFQKYYAQVLNAYVKIFTRVGLRDKTILTFASGGTFSKYSHEFQTITSAGEDIIYICEHCTIAVNREIIQTQKNCPQCAKALDTSKAERAIEVGNIFPLQTKFSKAFQLNYKDAHGVEQPIIMGCYGIGLGRLLGAIVEVFHDDLGIIWPAAVAPFDVHLLRLHQESKVRKAADQCYDTLQKQGVAVLYDDRDDSSIGEKLADADLIGIPLRLVVSEKTILRNRVEVKRRNETTAAMISLQDLAKCVRYD